MDGFKEKKWFVYLSDHHEGPFSLEEIEAKMGQAQVSTQNYVWADGMADWKPMTEVSAFEALIRARSNPTGTSSGAVSAPELVTGPQSSSLSVEPISASLSSPAIEPAAAPVAPEPLAMATETASPVITIQAAPSESSRSVSLVMEPHQPRKYEPLPGPIGSTSMPQNDVIGRSPKKGRLAPLLLLILLGGGGYYAYQQGYLKPVIDQAGPQAMELLGKIPGIDKWISPIPALPDVSPEEYEGLKAAAKVPAGAAASVGLALSNAQPETPVLYISSNAPDGTQAQVSIDGIPETLLMQLSFKSQQTVTIAKKLAKTEPFRFPDGKMIPRGQYAVTVSVGEAKETRTYFLGGAKDTTYAGRLKEFHDKLREKAVAELAEVEQFAGTLEAQLVSTNSKFAALKTKATGKQAAKTKKEWAAFHASWTALDSKLNETFGKWTPEIIQNELFYGKIYQQLVSAAQSIDRTHIAQNSLFENAGKADTMALDLQVGEVAAAAQNELATLKMKVEKAKSLPPTANGMPQREGI